MSSSSSSRGAEHTVEFLPETRGETNELDEDLRRVVAGIVIELHDTPYLGELMGKQPPEILADCRKIRFDHPRWRGKPRYRFVYRNEPHDEAVANVCVLALGPRRRMIAYIKAASRLARRMAEEGRF